MAAKTERVSPAKLAAGDVIFYGGAWAVIGTIERVRIARPITSRGAAGQRQYRVSLTHESNGNPYALDPHLSPYTKIMRRLEENR